MNKILCASKHVSSFSVLYKSLEKYVGKPNCVSFSTFIEHLAGLCFGVFLFGGGCFVVVFYLYFMCTSICLHICVSQACLVPSEVRRRCWTTWK